MYKGYFELGGAEIGNTQRAYGYSRNSDCPVTWLRTDDCTTMADLTDGRPYGPTSANLAPWYDPDRIDLSSRFYGVSVISIDGVEDSTRSAAMVERVDDGGKITGYRHNSREVRIRTFLSAKGMDALSYGMMWLRQTLEPGSCSMHGTACGLADFSYFVDCPPVRGYNDTYSDWTTQWTNLATNPSFETTSGTVEVRRNLVLDPQMVSGANANTDGYGTGGLGAITYSATAGADGRRAAIMTWSTAATSGGSTFGVGRPGQGDILVTAGTVVSASIYVSVNQARPANSLFAIIGFYDSTGAGVGTPVSGTVTVTPVAGGLYLLKVENVTVPATATRARIGARVADLSGSTTGFAITISNPIVEVSPVVGTYFDGGQQPKVRRNLATYPQPLVGNFVVSGTGTASAQTATPPAGTAGYWRNTLTAAAAAGAWGTDMNGGVAVYSGQVITFSVYVRASVAGNVTVTGIGTATGLTNLVNPTVAVAANTWTRIYFSATVGTGGLLGIRLRHQVAAAIGNTFEVGAVLVESGTTSVGTYFDGSTGAPQGFTAAWEGTANASPSYLYDSDFTTTWTGTANASASTLTAPAVPGATTANPANRLVYSSTRWSKSGTRSARITPVATTPEPGGIRTVVFAAGDVGKTFTALATIHLDAPQTGTLLTQARRIVLVDGSTYPAMSLAAPNVAGDTDLRVTFTVTASGQTLNLIGGSAIGGGDVWWDNLLLVEGAYDGDYFDGATPSPAPPAGQGPLPQTQYLWTGTANASTSIMQTRTWTPTPYTQIEYEKQVEPWVRILHDVAVVSGPMVTQEFVSADKETYAYLVEFTIVAENPFIYTIPKTVPLGAPVTGVIQDVPYNLVPYPSMELSSGTVEVARNYAVNPSAETDVSSWALYGDGTVITSAMLALTRSTTIASVGTASARVAFTATAASTGAPAFGVQQEVTIPDPLKRYSINLWAFGAINSGTAVMGTIAVTAYWRAAGATLRTDPIGTMPASGGPLSLANILPPPTATSVIVRAALSMTSYSSGAAVYLYGDALAVTNP